MKNILLLATILCAFNIDANEVMDRVKKYNWNGMDVTYLEDNRFPTFNLIFYFADGALSDGYRKGETSLAFNMLTAGTNRFTKKEIDDNLEFYGVSAGANVVHEYSTYRLSGLAKDIIPTVKKVCHLFKDSIYPAKELKTIKRNIISSKRNMTNNPGSLASKAFREISLAGTPFVSPVSGKIKTIKKIRSKNLRNKLYYFNERVKKKIYVTGPKSVLDIKKIVTNECGWNTKADFERKVSYKKPKRSPLIHLISVPKANQARVVAGKFLGPGEFENSEQLSVAGQYLGGGFTSVLMEELRVKRGLTYTASAFAGGQKDYGRSVISTFTKQESVEELINVIKETLKEKSSGAVTDKDLARVKKSLAGAYPFQFEKSSNFLNELMFLDHLGKSYDRFFNYNKIVDKMTLDELAQVIQVAFPWNGMDIVVLGEQKLAKRLRKLGRVKVHNYQKFL